MTPEQQTLLVLAGLGAAVIVLLLLGQQPATAGAAAGRPGVALTSDGRAFMSYQNEESWTLERDPRSGRLTGITVHRDARAGAA